MIELIISQSYHSQVIVRRFVARVALFLDGVAADLRAGEAAREQGFAPEPGVREFSQGEARCVCCANES